jgi:hypothetical protein
MHRDRSMLFAHLSPEQMLFSYEKVAEVSGIAIAAKHFVCRVTVFSYEELVT